MYKFCWYSGGLFTFRPPTERLRGYDGIGRRAGFRFLCRKACGFDSHYPYHVDAKFVRRHFPGIAKRCPRETLLARLQLLSNPNRICCAGLLFYVFCIFQTGRASVKRQAPFALSYFRPVFKPLSSLCQIFIQSRLPIPNAVIIT